MSSRSVTQCLFFLECCLYSKSCSSISLPLLRLRENAQLINLEAFFSRVYSCFERFWRLTCPRSCYFSTLPMRLKEEYLPLNLFSLKEVFGPQKPGYNRSKGFKLQSTVSSSNLTLAYRISTSSARCWQESACTASNSNCVEYMIHRASLTLHDAIIILLSPRLSLKDGGGTIQQVPSSVAP